jgi:DNA-binding XRE family transcriptional regulator
MSNLPDNDDDTIAYKDSVLGQTQMTFGRAIWSFRKCEDLTQTDVAKQLGISKQMLSAYERGKKLPSLKLAYKMATLLQLNVDLALMLVINDQLREAELPMQVTQLAS